MLGFLEAAQSHLDIVRRYLFDAPTLPATSEALSAVHERSLQKSLTSLDRPSHIDPRLLRGVRQGTIVPTRK